MKPHGVVPAHASAPSGPTASLVISVAPPSPPFGVFLGRFGYAAAWLAIHAFHVVCAAYFIAAGLFYRAIAYTQVGGMLRLYSLTVDRKHFRAIGIAHFVVAALHVRILLTTLIEALIHAFVSHRHQKKLRSLKRRVTHRRMQLTARGYKNAKRRKKVLVTLLYVYGVLLAPSGLFGVESSYFETLFLMRELAETSMQAFQAYKMSILLPRALLNRFYVVVLILNCWSTPLLHKFGGKNHALLRLLCLLSDILLDFVSAVGVPVVLALHYYDDYKIRQQDFPSSVWYNDKWLVQFMGDAPLILVGSWVDAFSRLVFSLGLLATNDDVKILIKRKTTAVVDVNAVQAQPVSFQQQEPRAEIQQTRLVRWAHRFMVLFGLTILVVQLYAESKPKPVACVLHVRPWFVERPAASINCLCCGLSKASSAKHSGVTLAETETVVTKVSVIQSGRAERLVQSRLSSLSDTRLGLTPLGSD